MTAAARQDGDYAVPVLAPAADGPVPRWIPLVSVDNASSNPRRRDAGNATAGASPVTEESG